MTFKNLCSVGLCSQQGHCGLQQCMPPLLLLSLALIILLEIIVPPSPNSPSTYSDKRFGKLTLSSIGLKLTPPVVSSATSGVEVKMFSNHPHVQGPNGSMANCIYSYSHQTDRVGSLLSVYGLYCTKMASTQLCFFAQMPPTICTILMSLYCEIML